MARGQPPVPAGTELVRVGAPDPARWYRRGQTPVVSNFGLSVVAEGPPAIRRENETDADTSGSGP